MLPPQSSPFTDAKPHPLSAPRRIVGLLALVAVIVGCGALGIFLRGGAPDAGIPNFMSSAAILIIGVGLSFLGLLIYGLTLATNAFTFNFSKPFFRSYRLRFWASKFLAEFLISLGFAWICAPSLLILLSGIAPGQVITLMSFGLPFILAQVLFIWLNLWAPLESSVIARRMKAIGLTPDQYPDGFLIGVSDPDKSSMKKFVMVEEDLGVLWLTPTHLTYRGDSTYWDIAREDLLQVERKADPGSTASYFGAVHVILHTRQAHPDNPAQTRKIRLHTQADWTLTKKAKALDALSQQLETWRESPSLPPS